MIHFSDLIVYLHRLVLSRSKAISGSVDLSIVVQTGKSTGSWDRAQSDHISPDYATLFNRLVNVEEPRLDDVTNFKYE